MAMTPYPYSDYPSCPACGSASLKIRFLNESEDYTGEHLSIRCKVCHCRWLMQTTEDSDLAREDEGTEYENGCCDRECHDCDCEEIDPECSGHGYIRTDPALTTCEYIGPSIVFDDQSQPVNYFDARLDLCHTPLEHGDALQIAMTINDVGSVTFHSAVIQKTVYDEETCQYVRRDFPVDARPTVSKL